jgi:teichoic acid transport system permease protein
VKPAGGAGARKDLIAHIVWAVFFFTFVSNALMGGARSIINGRGLVLNASFPRAVLPLVAIVKSVFDFIPTLLVYLALHAILGQPFGVSLVYLPVIIAILVVMNMGLALLFSPLMVFFRDTGGFLPYVNRIWLYVTPALYTVATIPKNLLTYLRWNPLYPSFAALEQIFAAHAPSKTYLLAASGWSFGLFFFGAIVFLARERDFAVRL